MWGHSFGHGKCVPNYAPRHQGKMVVGDAERTTSRFEISLIKTLDKFNVRFYKQGHKVRVYEGFLWTTYRKKPFFELVFKSRERVAQKAVFENVGIFDLLHESERAKIRDCFNKLDNATPDCPCYKKYAEWFKKNTLPKKVITNCCRLLLEFQTYIPFVRA